jgi:hypothetical protein
VGEGEREKGRQRQWDRGEERTVFSMTVGMTRERRGAAERERQSRMECSMMSGWMGRWGREEGRGRRREERE